MVPEHLAINGVLALITIALYFTARKLRYQLFHVPDNPHSSRFRSHRKSDELAALRTIQGLFSHYWIMAGLLGE